jgi:hypothetical protein
MTISLVNNTQVLTHDLYNQLATVVTNLAAPTSTGYGFDAAGINTVTNTMQITLQDWQKLYFETNQIYNHVYGTPIVIDQTTLPTKANGIPLKASLVNSIIGAVNTITANPYSAAPSQLLSISIDDVSNNAWDSTITSVVDIPFSDTISTQHFFNLGGYIRCQLTFSEVFPGTIEDQWIGLITEMQTIMAANPYNRTLYSTLTPHTFSTNVTATGDYITLVYTPVSNYEIYVTVSLIVGTQGAGADSAIPKHLKVTNTVKTYYSAGSLPSPVPTTQSITTSFHQGGQAIVPYTRILSIDRTDITYHMNQYDESTRELITLTNNGNCPIFVAAIIFSNNSNGQGPLPNLLVDSNWTNTAPNGNLLLLQPNASATVALSYTGQHLGTYNNFLHIYGNFDNATNGFVTIKTRQVIGGPIFRPQLLTTSTINVDSYHVIQGQVGVYSQHIALDYYSLGNFSLLWNGQDLSGNRNIFSIDATKPEGPILSFNPESFLAYAGTTTAVLTATVSVNCTSVSVPGAPSQSVTTTTTTVLNLNVPATQHLGDWLSPTSLGNSVVGMSYDLINAKPYLTIGVGLTQNNLYTPLTNTSTSINVADLAKQIWTSSTAYGNFLTLTDPLPADIADKDYNLNVANLGATADPQWLNGVPLYKVNSSNWTQGDPVTGFLHDYGVWFYPDGVSPSGLKVQRTYSIDVKTAGNYVWKIAADNIGWFSIDGNVVGDTRTLSTSTQVLGGTSGTISLTRGVHILSVYGVNLYADLTHQVGVAITIVNSLSSQMLWNTLVPVRDTKFITESITYPPSAPDQSPGFPFNTNNGGDHPFDYSGGPFNSPPLYATNSTGVARPVKVTMVLDPASHVNADIKIYRTDGVLFFDSGMVGWNYNQNAPGFSQPHPITYTITDTIPNNTTYGYYMTVQTYWNGDYDYSLGSMKLVSASIIQLSDPGPYAGWSEVYRIPLDSVGTGIPKTYNMSGFVVKDSGSINYQYKYSDFFGSPNQGPAGFGAIFLVKDDGFGNLSIQQQFQTITTGQPEYDQTLTQLQYATYYYDDLNFNAPGGQSFSNHAARVHNLDHNPLGNGHQCRQFLGFDSDGNVLTHLTRYPGDGGFDPVPRYIIGSMNLVSPGTAPKTPDPSVLEQFISAFSSPVLILTNVGIGLWSGATAHLLINTGRLLQNITGSNLVSRTLGSWGETLLEFEPGGTYGISTLLKGTTVGPYLTAFFTGNTAVEGTGYLGAALGWVGTAIPYISAAILIYQYGGQIFHSVGKVVSGIANAVGDLVGGAVHFVGGIIDDLSNCCVVATELRLQGIWSDRQYKAINIWGAKVLDSTALGRTYHRGYHMVAPKIFVPAIRQAGTLQARYFIWTFETLVNFLRNKKYHPFSIPNTIFWLLVFTTAGFLVSNQQAELSWRSIKRIS